MSLAQILYPPPTKQGMEEWFQAHMRHHQAIAAAAGRLPNPITLEVLPIYPANESDLQDWLGYHQRMHFQMNAAFGVAGTDLSVLDLKDKRSADSWFFQHFLQHQAAGAACGEPV